MDIKANGIAYQIYNKYTNLMGKIKGFLFIKRYDFYPEIKSGYIDEVENVAFYAMHGIGDLIVASPIIKHVMNICSGRVYFICNSSSLLYIEVLQKQYDNIVPLLLSKKRDVKEGDIDRTACKINQSGGVDVIVNGIGRIDPLFAKLAYLVKPNAVISCIEGRRKRSKNKMAHGAIRYSSALFRQKVPYVDCWGMLTQIIGGRYDRKTLFPEFRECPVSSPYIALSLSGVSRGSMATDDSIALCAAIFRHYDKRICLLPSPGQEVLCNVLTSAFENVFLPEEGPSLETTGLYIKYAQALVSVCSAPVHIAGAFNTPTLVITSLYAPHWFPVVDHWDIYVTSGDSIRNFDCYAFEQKFVEFISGV